VCVPGETPAAARTVGAPARTLTAPGFEPGIAPCGVDLAGGFATRGPGPTDAVVLVVATVTDDGGVVVPAGDCVLAPAVQVLATQTGALAFTGAFAVVPFAPVEPWFELWPVQVLATQTGAFAFTGAFADVWLVVDPPELWFEPWPLQVLAMQTGAFAFAGAFAELPPLVVDPPEL
jgi:hypothetical protein